MFETLILSVFIHLGTKKNRRSVVQQRVLDSRLDLCQEFHSLSIEDKRSDLIHYCKQISEITLNNCRGEPRTFETDQSDPEDPDFE